MELIEGLTLSAAAKRAPILPGRIDYRESQQAVRKLSVIFAAVRFAPVRVLRYQLAQTRRLRIPA